MKDYYKILELNRQSGVRDIRKAYRRLALKLHPDVNSSVDAKTNFVAVNEAYEVLKYPTKRIHYDRLYDQLILNQKVNNNKQHQNKTWAETVLQKQRKGKTKAEEMSKMENKPFKKKTLMGRFFDWAWAILRFFVQALDIFSIAG